MAKQAVKKFEYNAALNNAIKERFGAKWDATTGTWTVNTKEKAVQANSLVDEVRSFERDKMLQAGEVEFHNKFNETHPGYSGFHPLTGATWHFMRSDLWARAHGADRDQAKKEFMDLMEKMGIK